MTSYECFLKTLQVSYSCVSSILPLWGSVWDPRAGWGVAGWLFHHPCPAGGVGAGADVLFWLCCSATALVLRRAKPLQVYLLPPRHQDIGEQWGRLRSKGISLLCLLHGLFSPQGHLHCQGTSCGSNSLKTSLLFCFAYSLRNFYLKMKPS